MLIFGLLPFALLLDPPPGEPFTWLLVTAFLEWFAWRGLRLGAHVGRSRVVVCGHLWDRTISRQSITGLTDYVSILWTDGRGQTRERPIRALAYNPRALASINREAETESRRLRQALGFDARVRKPPYRQ